MKTSELTGAALDWAVAVCEEFIESGPYGEPAVRDGQLHLHYCGVVLDAIWQPTADWAQGGPIIEQEGISTILCAGGLGEPRSYWVATTGSQSWDRGYGPYHEQDEEQSIQLYRGGTSIGPTPLIAAMRCFVASKLGDDIEIPEELA